MFKWLLAFGIWHLADGEETPGHREVDLRFQWPESLKLKRGLFIVRNCLESEPKDYILADRGIVIM